MMFASCEDQVLLEIKKKNYKTVNVELAKKFLTTQQNKLKAETNGFNLNYVVDLLDYEAINNNEALLAVVPANSNFDHIYSRILLLEVDGVVQSVLFNMIAEEDSNEIFFSGKIVITDFYGKFRGGYKVEDGLITSQYVKSESQKSMINTKSSCNEDLANGIFCFQDLEEIIVVADLRDERGGFEFSGDFWGGDNINVGATGGASTNESWDYGGSDTTNNNNGCPEGQIKDDNGNCVQEEKPCPGDPVPNPKIAPQKGASGIKSGLFGCNRFYSKSICGGVKGSKKHAGIDIKSNYGDPIYATHDGTSRLVTQFKKGKVVGAGHYVEITSVINGSTVKILYFHLQKENRKSGSVKAGDIIGYQGDSGNLKNGIAQGYAESHVHIKMKIGNNSVDPKYLSWH